MYKVLLLLLTSATLSFAQSDMESLREALLVDTPIENDLQELCDRIGGRVTGSLANEEAVKWGLRKFKEAGVSAWKDSFDMPSLWLERSTKGIIRGDIQFFPQLVAKYQTAPGQHMGELINIGMGSEEEILDKMSQLRNNYALVETDLCLDINGLFAEYTQAAKVEMAIRKHTKASGIVFMSSRPSGLLYRFITSKGVENDLPQFIMAREDAKRCKRSIEQGAKVEFLAMVDAQIGEDYTSHNVIAEIKGTEKPEEIILIGAHLDSWALGTGANDNGCNVAMMIDLARQMTALDIKPKRTIRFALWNGEEQGYFGSWAYARKNDMEKHKLAISIDIGSGEIVGFFTNGRNDVTEMTEKLLKPINKDGTLTTINAPIIGTDNFDFMIEGVPNLVGAHKPASYGTNYHASSDTYDKVDFVSLKKNAALMAYVILSYANADNDMMLPRHSRAQIQAMLEEHETEFTMRMFNVWEPWIKAERGRK